MRKIFRKAARFEGWSFFFIFVFAVCSVPPILAFPQNARTVSDSLSIQTQIDLQLAQIERQTAALSDSNLAGEVGLFQRLAEAARDEGDFSLASFYVKSAFDLLAPQGNPSAPAAGGERVPSAAANSVFQNQWNVSSGMDVSRQDFEIVYSGRDSNLIDATNDPFIGIGLDGLGQLGEKTSLNWNGSARFSRDYNLADWHASAQRSWASSQTATLWTDFEAMAYRRDLHMKYAQALGGIQWQGHWSDKCNSFLEYEISKRRYDKPDRNFPSYLRSRARGYLKIYPPIFRWIRLSGEIESRTHSQFPELDYSQKQVSVRSAFNLFKTRATFQLEHRSLDYQNDSADTLFYFGSYRDLFSTFSAKRPLVGPFAFKLNGFWVRRTYVKRSSFLVDYDYLNVTPAITWSLSSSLSLELGYLLIQKKYHKSQNEPAYWAVSDYSVRGPQLGIDFLNFRNIMLSAQISYERRRHKDDNGTTEGFNLYTNQNETTAMIFASWQFFSNYELNVMLHRDAAIDQELEHNDSRVSIFTVELRRTF